MAACNHLETVAGWKKYYSIDAAREARGLFDVKEIHLAGEDMGGGFGWPQMDGSLGLPLMLKVMIMIFLYRAIMRAFRGKLQYDFTKIRGGIKGHLKLFRKFIRFGTATRHLGWPQTDGWLGLSFWTQVQEAQIKEGEGRKLSHTYL